MALTFERSFETAKIVSLMQTMSLQKPMSYDEASAIVGFRVHSTLGAYRSARRIVEKEGIVIGTILKFGFQRMTAEMVSESGEQDMLAIRRRSRRGGRRQEIAISGNLDQRHMLRSTELLGRFRILEDNSSPARTNRFRQEPPQSAQDVDPRERLKAMAT